MKIAEKPRILDEVTNKNVPIGTIIWTIEDIASYNEILHKNDEVWLECDGTSLDDVNIDYPDLFKAFGGESLSAYNNLSEEDKLR